MFVNMLYQGGIRALLDYDNTLFDNMVLPEGVDRNEVIDQILFKYGKTPLFSPDPEVMKYYIQSWSAKRIDQWQRFKDAIEIEYAPLENYDRMEEGEVTFSPTTTQETQISADNASTYQPDRKSISGGKDTTASKLRAHGNIGVTTSQQMLASELDLVPRLSIIDYIADDFKIEFCLYMYN